MLFICQTHHQLRFVIIIKCVAEAEAASRIVVHQINWLELKQNSFLQVKQKIRKKRNILHTL